MSIRFPLFGCVALLLLPAFTASAAKRVITHEDVWLMKRVGRPTVSPDGRWVVFQVTEPAYDAKDQTSDLWLAPTDGSQPPRPLTRTKGTESDPSWSPDARRLAFSAKRDPEEVPQIYCLDMTGGEAERVTQLSTGARTPRWSPDGTQLLFTSEVYPDAADDAANMKAAREEKGRKWHAHVYEGFPIRYWDKWLDRKRAHLFVQQARPGAIARDLFADSRLAAAPGFSGKESEAGEELAATWTPDGKHVVFVARVDRDKSAYQAVASHLFVVDLTGGEPRALTSGADSYGSPVFRPDGNALLAEYTPGGDGRIYHHDRVASFPWPFDARQRVVLTSELDLSVSGFSASGDSRTIYFTAEDAEQIKLYSVNAAGGAVSSVPIKGEGVFSGLAVAGSTMIVNRENALSPPEVGRINLAELVWKPLTRFNEERLAPLDITPLESFRFRSSRGREIHSLIVRPPGFDPAKKYPLFVMLHGGPSPQFKNAWGIRWNFHLLASPGYVMVLTNYSGSRGYSEAFAQAIQGDPLKGPADEINEAADEAIKRYGFIDGTRQVAGGASYGGHLAHWLQATTTRYRALVAHAGLVNLESQWATSDSIFHREVGAGGPVWEQGAVWTQQNPVRLAGNHAKGTGWVTPMLLTVGERDYRVPFNNTLESWSYHQRLRIPSKLIVFPEENHWILRGENSRFWYSEVHAWFAKWLAQ